MPKVKISEFSSTPANNTDIDSINIAENCPPSSINDAIRELMAQLKDFQTGAVGDSFNGPVGTTTAAAGAFTTLSASGAVTLSGGTANGVAYLNGSKVVTSGSALTFDGTNFVNTAGFLGTTQSGATSSYFIAKNSVATSGVVFGAHSSGAGYIDVINNNPLFFAVNDTEQMRLTSTGLGIGTSAPLSKLQVASNTSIAWGVGANATYGATTIGSASTSTSSLFVNTASLNTGYSSGLAVDGTYSSSISTVNLKALGVYSGGGYGGQLAFWTSSETTATQRMLLDSSGNLGLGVTPTSGWLSSRKVFQFGATGSVANNSGNTLLGDNYYTDSTPTNRYLTTAASTLYQQTSGTHVWYNAPSGTAGNAITFTQAMTLDASGNLMVGTTTPSANSKLTLSGAGITIAGGRGSTYALNWADWSVYNSSSGNALVFDNGTERARIDSSGTFSVSQSNNAVSMSLLNTSASLASNVLSIYPNRNTSNGTYNLIGAGVNGVGNRFVVADSGNVTNTNNSYGAISDIKLKENIVDATPKLAGLMQVKVRNYNMIGNTTKQIGVVAQELETVFPAMVDESPDRDAEGNDLGTTTKSVKYSVFVPMLIKAIQEQQAIIESMRTEIDALKAKVGA